MTVNDPNYEPTVDVNKKVTPPETEAFVANARESLDEAAEKTATVVNNNFGTELNAQSVNRSASAFVGIILTAGVAYWAGKKGVQAGMKDYVRTGQSLVDAAGGYADAAQIYAGVASDNARYSLESVDTVRSAVETAVKTLKKK